MYYILETIKFLKNFVRQRHGFLMKKNGKRQKKEGRVTYKLKEKLKKGLWIIQAKGKVWTLFRFWFEQIN